MAKYEFNSAIVFRLAYAFRRRRSPASAIRPPPIKAMLDGSGTSEANGVGNPSALALATKKVSGPPDAPVAVAESPMRLVPVKKGCAAFA